MATVSGSAVLHDIDRGLASLRQEMRSMDSVIEAASQRIRELGETKLSLYRQLAVHRLAEVERGEIVNGLESVSHEIGELLQRRQNDYRELLEKIDDAEARLDALERQREEQREEAESAALALDEAEAAVQEGLEHDTAYNAQLEQAHRADSIADEAEEKTRDALADKASKGEPYESDPLFMYLWRRGYGTADYDANPLTRLLDRWVAGLCGYDRARPNYWMLGEIPKRLQAHAEAARADADAEFEKLQDLETEAGKQMGLPGLRQALDAREKVLAECDESIEVAEKELAELADERSLFAAGRDGLMLTALERLAAEMRNDGIRALERRAASTPGIEDDRLVDALVDVDERLAIVEAEHRDRQKIYGRSVSKLRDLESLRREYKRRGYDDARSVFTDRATVANGLQQFLRGLLDDDDFLRILRRAHRLRQVRSRPGFGSGGFPHRGGTWRLPRSGANWPDPGRRGGFRLPRGGGFRRPGGGGFSTGGGF